MILVGKELNHSTTDNQLMLSFLSIFVFQNFSNRLNFFVLGPFPKIPGQSLIFHLKKV